MKLKTLKNVDFNSVIKEGRCLKTECCVICYRKNQEKRFGFTVKKKIKVKPVRNRIRRRLKEIIRLNIEKIPDGDWVFIGSEKAKEMEFSRMERLILECIQKLSATSNPS